jgi:hypothetical protein
MTPVMGRGFLADALVRAAARSPRAEAVHSFDERLPRDGVTIRREGR